MSSRAIKKVMVTCAVYFAVVVVFSRVQITAGCNSDSDCPPTYSHYYYKLTRYCCERKYYPNICLTSCVGQSCSSDSACGPSECCDATTERCQTSYCDEFSSEGDTLEWRLPVIIAGSVVGAVFVCLFLSGLCRRATRGSARAGVVVRQPAAAGTTVIPNQQQQQAHVGQESLPMYSQNAPPYPAQTSVAMPSETGECKY